MTREIYYPTRLSAANQALVGILIEYNNETVFSGGRLSAWCLII